MRVGMVAVPRAGSSTRDVLECMHLSKVYRMGEVDVRALDGVDLALRAR